MQRVVRRFSSFEEEERANRAYYQSLSPEERLDILLELIQRHAEAAGDTSGRIERVYRIRSLSQD